MATMSLEEYWNRFIEIMREKGHTPTVDEDGNVNMFVTDFGYHNGHGCSTCGWTTCIHCDGIEKIPECDAALSKASGKET